MRKKVIIITVAAILFVTTVITASKVLGGENKPTKNKNFQTTDFEPSFEQLAEFMGYNTDEKFQKFHKTALFMGKYCTNEETFSYIEEMILDGCDVQTVMDIYQFYLTTNEDISIVRQIYDMVWDSEPIENRDIVFENAFNEITNNKCGVLTENDIIAYMEKGLSVSDISQANLLCRKGVLTINEILDLLVGGTTWKSIVETVSGESIDAEYSQYEGQALVVAMNSADIDEISINEVLSGETKDYTEKTKKINKQLKEKGHWKGKKSKNFEKIVKTAKNKGIPENKLEQLMNEGYSECDLINAITHAECTKETIDSIIEREAEKE